jgi:hypothetical protein
MNWRPVELIADYWIIQNKNYDEYVDPQGDNLMFETKAETLDKIKEINNEAF